MNASARIPVEAGLNWDADLDETDGTLNVTVGMRYSFETDAVIDGSEPFLAGFWHEYLLRVRDEVDRGMVAGDTGYLRERLAVVMEPVRLMVEQALDRRFCAMLDDLAIAHQKLAQAVPGAEPAMTTLPRLAGLTAGQGEVLARALADAIEWRQPAMTCADCDAAEGGLCPDHVADETLASAYAHLAAEIGLEVPR